jgi:lambda family phage minor tail protein L
VTIIPEHIQKHDLGARIFLYELDLTEFGLGVIRLAPGTAGSVAVGFGGETYSPHPVKADGFEMSTVGSLPRPNFAVANLDNSFTALVDANDDLQGGVLTRIRTYDRYLDSGAEPDGDKHLPLEIFLLSQKTVHTEEQIEWACAALMDQEGVELPGRVINRDYCDHPYRRWTGSGFDYTNVTCPYVGTDYFDEDGNPTTAAFDKASKRLKTCCMPRFGANGVLPTRAFPGVSRLTAR